MTPLCLMLTKGGFALRPQARVIVDLTNRRQSTWRVLRPSRTVLHSIL